MTNKITQVLRKLADWTPMSDYEALESVKNAGKATPKGPNFKYPNDFLDQETRQEIKDNANIVANTSLNTALTGLGFANNAGRYGLRALGVTRFDPWFVHNKKNIQFARDAVDDYYKPSSPKAYTKTFGRWAAAGGTLLGGIPELYTMKTTTGHTNPFFSPFVNRVAYTVGKYGPKAMDIVGVTHSPKTDTKTQQNTKRFAKEFTMLGASAINPLVMGRQLAMAYNPELRKMHSENMANRAVDIAQAFPPKQGWAKTVKQHADTAVGAAGDWFKEHPEAQGPFKRWGAATVGQYANKVNNSTSPNAPIDAANSIYNDSELAQHMWNKVHRGKHSWLLSALGVQGDRPFGAIPTYDVPAFYREVAGRSKYPLPTFAGNSNRYQSTQEYLVGQTADRLLRARRKAAERELMPLVK